MTYVYILESVYARERRYVGLTNDLRQRLACHNEGKSPHTRKYKPWNLVCYLGFADLNTAREFELYLKTASGTAFPRKRFLRKPAMAHPEAFL